MSIVTGTMVTDRPARYAKQLVSHWANRGPVTTEDGATVQRWKTGQVIVLRPADGCLEVEARVGENGEISRFAQLVQEHLERLGRRNELHVVWHD